MNTMIKKFVFVLLLALVGVQSAFALRCEGTIHVKVPSTWSSPNIMIDGSWIKLPAAALQNGWYVLNATEFGGSISERFIFAESDWMGAGITTKHYNVKGGIDGWRQDDAFSCEDLSLGNLYVYENPVVSGTTVYGPNPPDAKYFFVMIPPDMEDWMADLPMLSFDGGKTGKPLTAVADMCGWYSYIFWNEEISDNVVLYRDGAAIDPVTGIHEDLIGLRGNWEDSDAATPIPMGLFFGMGVDSLFFVPDEDQKTNEDGFYFSAAEIDGIEGTCSYSLAAIIYDTDALLHPSFSCYSAGGEGCQFGFPGVDTIVVRTAINACIGVTPGIVESTLDPATKKPKLAKAGEKCFINEKFFNQLFNYTEGVNEKSCFDMPFWRSQDGKWEFDSDYYTSPGAAVQGGFYPVELSEDATILAADPTQTPVSQARFKRLAEGPTFYAPLLRENDPIEGAPVLDIACNGPGWDGGHDCTGLFADGEYTEAAFEDWYPGLQGMFGWSAYYNAPTGWPYFVQGTETYTSSTSSSANPRWYSKEGRNQHFCFESHAKFTHKPGLRFSFRGDDDIWVFIDNKLAVDIGGTHLAAPGYVDLDRFEGLSGSLVYGNKYDIDIFFCDRRTTMSNVRIKTNMYIQQKVGIDIKKTKKANGEEDFRVCYTQMDDGSCAAAMSAIAEVDTVCDENIVNVGIPVSYTLVHGNSISSEPEEGFVDVSTPGVYKCGIDLTNITSPKIDKSKVCLNPGRYTLFMNINGKSAKVATFRAAGGNVDVVYRNAVTKDANDEVVPDGNILIQTSALGGDLVPVYISSVDEPLNDGDPLEVFPQEASGIMYTLSYSDVMEVFYKDADGKLVPLTSGQKRIVGTSGIDTVYATVSMSNLTKPIESFDIKVSGGKTVMSISYYLPKLAFVSTSDPTTAVQEKGQQPDADGTYEERWVGSVYDLYVAILKPDVNGKYYFCQQECDGIKIHKGIETSPKIEFVSDTVAFVNGVATVSVRSLKAYRYDTDPEFDNPATIAVEYNDAVGTTYSPIYFRQSPVPYPVMADVFDVHGATPAQKYKIPEPYFSMNYEYLDGIADSVAIYFNRALHKDSLPSKVCVLWDSVSAETHNPYEEGFSTSPKDTQVYCNALISVNRDNIDCSSKKDGYCSKVVTVGGVALSKDVKTAGVGKVYAYSEFKDKGKSVKQSFVGALTDRVAPVPLRAELFSMKNAKGEPTGRDSLVLTLSEPVVLNTESKKRVSLGFYLNSATSIKSEADRYVSTKVESELDPSITTDGALGKVRFVYDSKKLAPQVGDYVRLMADLDKIYWTDQVKLNSKDTLRAKADADYHWNSPTAYNETIRLPSPWVPVIKEGSSNNSEEKSQEGDEEFAEPSFRVKMVGPFQFKIVMDEPVTALQKTYAVMDLQGRVVLRGKITSAETVVPALGSGSYVVRIGIAMRRVNVK